MTYIVELSILIAIWTMLAVSFNLVIGFVGLLVVAHRLFYAFGAYGAGLLMIHTDMPAFVAIAITCMGAGLLSWRKASGLHCSDHWRSGGRPRLCRSGPTSCCTALDSS